MLDRVSGIHDLKGLSTLPADPTVAGLRHGRDDDVVKGSELYITVCA